MARGRMINRSAGESVKIAELVEHHGAGAGLFFTLLIAWLDVNGNVRADPWWLKGNVCPLIDGISPDDCRQYAAALVDLGLAVPYTLQRKEYLHFPGFRDEQVGIRPDREKAEVPVPEGFDESSGKMPESIRQPSGEDPPHARGGVRTEVEVENREVEVEKEMSEFVEEWREVFDYWREQRAKVLKKAGGPPMQPTDKRVSKIRARLREGYTPDDLKKAVDRCMASPFHVEGGHLDIELICRDQAHVERFLHGKPEPNGNGHTRPTDIFPDMTDEQERQWYARRDELEASGMGANKAAEKALEEITGWRASA